ncbi:DEAD/DEAH box helicase [Porphyromonas somerae]|uniref:DEAD/DEAH box helicase n=1 Tax=Porphyromonas somerae TaxID=322095 RepID=UPI00036687D9|nr:DEAD/DEAH box helicase [Porphyromonas somerae]
MKSGIYEHIINKETERDIQQAELSGLVCIQQPIDSAESPQILANYLAKAIRQKLEDIEEQQDRVNLINRIMIDAGLLDDKQIVKPSDLLAEVMSQQKAILQTQSNTHTVRPISGFRVSNLFTGGSSTLSLNEEIRREIASADEICFIVSFLKVSGVRLLLDELTKFCSREGTRLRIITTTYCGATQAKAIMQLAELPNTEIRILYNTNIERLHAKSYIFVRNSGMNTAYIGSSNLSKSAQTDGLEWNMRVTSIENPHIIKTVLATFEMYWNSPNFEDFRIGGIEKFNKEIHRNLFHSNTSEMVYQRYSLLPHQKQILDKLRVEREERGNFKNLIVAATGTGKTVISAFDYQEFARRHSRSRILFTAHREEILRQSLSTFRSVLQDANFGTLWVGANRPYDASDYDHLFVSINMFNSRFEEFFASLEADYYDYIVIDEAHHSQANSYRKLFDHFNPKLLIGLTATPERMDGQDLRPDFGGRISAEIRLPQALQAGLLTPFQYLCISDDIDLSDESLWSGLKYNNDRLADKLCSEARAKLIADSLQKYLADEYKCRALCFCVNKRHANFMADQLRLYGFTAQSLTSDTPPDERKQLSKNLRNGSLQYLCVVDIFNEGIDIPEVDTVLFLRPTESLTIFLQQLGRGLRLSAGKTELTVLDFVAQANCKYDFASRFRALTLHPEKNIKKQIEEGFTLLPMGCSIVMEKMARQYILDNISSAIYNKRRIIKEINSYTSIPTISQFLENNGQDIRVIYQGANCWSSLKRAARRISYNDDAITKHLEKGMANLIHHNTVSFLHFVARFIAGEGVHLEEAYKTYAIMLYYALFQDKISKVGFQNINEALELLFHNNYACFKQEISEIVSYLLANLSIKTAPIGIESLPKVELYGCYTREEIFTLVGRQTPEVKMQGAASGVFNLQEHNATLLFVTLNKSEKDFSPSTQYNDYLINEEFFHWQSQNTDSHNNNGGRRYTEQSKTKNKIILFVREEKKDGFGFTSPFHCFGMVDYVSSHDDFPMNITWKLHKPAMSQYLNAI